MWLKEALPTRIAEIFDSQILLKSDNQNERKTNSQVLYDAFVSLDSELLKRPLEMMDKAKASLGVSKLNEKTRLDILDKTKTSFSGSCALACILEGNNLIIANAGDCRTVIGRRNKEGLWEARALTRDHTPGTESEFIRLQTEHPNEPQVAFKPTEDSPMRVLGGMMPSRCT